MLSRAKPAKPPAFVLLRRPSDRVGREGTGKELPEFAGCDLAGLIDERDRKVARGKLRDRLEAEPTWGSAVESRDRERRDRRASRRDHRADRMALGTDGSPVADVLDIAADEDATLVVSERGTYFVARIGCVSVASHGAGGLQEFRIEHKANVTAPTHVP